GDNHISTLILRRGDHPLLSDKPVKSSQAEYNAAGRLLAIEHRLLGRRHHQSFAYDAGGRLVARQLPDGSRLRHAHDADGRPLALYWTAPDGVEQVLVDRARYRAGRIASFRLGGR